MEKKYILTIEMYCDSTAFYLKRFSIGQWLTLKCVSFLENSVLLDCI